MVSEISNRQSGYGQINRVGATQNGRVIYQLSDASGNGVGKVSVAAKDADTFEKCNNTIMQAAPKIEKYMQSMTPEKEEKNKKKTKWIIGLGALLGAAVPLFGCVNRRPITQILLTILGTVAGLVVGIGAASKITMPPNMIEFAQATRKMSKLDIQRAE